MTPSAGTLLGCNPSPLSQEDPEEMKGMRLRRGPAHSDSGGEPVKEEANG